MVSGRDPLSCDPKCGTTAYMSVTAEKDNCILKQTGDNGTF